MHPLTFLVVHERSSFTTLAVSLRRSVCSLIHSLDKKQTHKQKKLLEILFQSWSSESEASVFSLRIIFRSSSYTIAFMANNSRG